MLTISLAQLKADIIPKLKGTSLRQIKNFYGTAAAAANRMSARLDTEETIRTFTLSTPFYASVNDYVLATDYKKMLDLRPQANRTKQPGNSNFGATTARQFNERLDPNSFSIRWNNAIRTLRAQILPSGNCMVMDTFDAANSNGLWVAGGDASGLYSEPLNYVEGNGSLGMNLSGATGIGNILNTTAPITDLSRFLYEDASFMFVWIPTGASSRITSLDLIRGESASAYRHVTVTTKADGTAFTDGWNFLVFSWGLGSSVGSPTNLLNTYRKLTINYVVGAVINGFLVDNWTNDLGSQYEMEYYSECLFRAATGTFLYTPTQDTDLVNVGPASYEILKAEMMVDITQQIRTGSVRAAELADWRMMLNGQPPNRYVKDPQYRGLYADYAVMFPSSAITTSTRTYDFDV